MGAIDRFKAAIVRRFSTSDPAYPTEITGPPSYSGEEVTHSSSLALSAVWGCVNLIAGTTATLPCMVYRPNGDGQREVARGHPLYRVLHDSPNFDQTAVDFWEWMAASLELYGMTARISTRLPLISGSGWRRRLSFTATLMPGLQKMTRGR